MPTLIISAWLCGWALQEPDPVRDHVDGIVLITACLPFAVIAIRALVKALWSLVRKPENALVCTIGFLHPRIMYSPVLARTLEENQIQAAWQHEPAHAYHRDPLRIRLAQIAIDLQWPWPWAREHFEHWLEVLECSRDEEARYAGVSGVDLAAAVLATVRQSASSLGGDGQSPSPTREATLIGEPRVLQRRIARLLAPLPEYGAAQAPMRTGSTALMTVLIGMLFMACALGAIYGESVMHPLLAWTWTL
jgi:hypothetical protein